MLKELVKTLVAVLLVLFMLSRMASAEFVYDIQGVFAPTLTNPVSASFVGQFEFPEDNVSQLTGWVELTNEPDLVREFNASMEFNLPNYRLYSGTYGETPMAMVLMDYGNEAGNQFLASQLDGGGLWDSWVVSFADYQVGSLDRMDAHAVNEPGAFALLALGGVVFMAMVRSARKG